MRHFFCFGAIHPFFMIPRPHGFRLCLPGLAAAGWLASAALAGGDAALVAGAQGQPRPLPAVAMAELARRQAALDTARADLAEGRDLAAKGDSAAALARFIRARDGAVNAPAGAALRAEARRAFAETATAEARRLAGEARYAEARELLGRALDPAVEPAYAPALRLQAELLDGDRYPPAASPALAADVAKVADGLRLAESHFLLGRYTEAIDAYNDVLVVDPYNKAAREGQIRVERAAQEYFTGSAYTHTRARMIAQVDALWESPNPERNARIVAEALGTAQSEEEIATRNRAMAIARKMREMMIPQIRIERARLREAVEYLVALSRRFDTQNPDPATRGVDILIQIGGEDEPFAKEVLAREISLSLDNVPFETALEYVAKELGLDMRVEGFAVLLVPPGDADKYLFTRTYNVPPDFISSVPAAGAVGGDDPFAEALGVQGLMLRRLTARQFLEQAGISFPEGTLVVFDARTSTLTMRNTRANHEALEEMVERARNSTTPQVQLEVKMIEVAEDDAKELGFDWLVGAFSVGGGMFGSGGSGDLGATAGLDPSGSPWGRNPVTAGNRSGQLATTTPALDRLIAVRDSGALRGGTTRAPAALALVGALTEPQFQVMLRALDQKKGRDLLIAPTVVSRSGLPARIELIREFNYPTEYEPPQLVQNQTFPGIGGGGGIDGGGDLPGAPIPPIPASPNAFTMEPIGTILNVEPIVAADGSMVEVNLDLVHKEFLGFVNYGSDINWQGGPIINRILQPIFETRRVNNAVSVYDGETLVLGGLVSDFREQVNDKVPLLGDLPLIGRLFQSSVDVRSRKVLMFFLTVRTLDPAGRPARQSVADAVRP
jgi:general secretion pathway protein D